VAIRLTPLRPLAHSRHGEPVTAGVPLPKGLCHDPAHLLLEDGAGQRMPLQVRPLDRWADGSLRWALLDTRLDVRALESAQWYVRVSADTRVHDTGGLTLSRSADAYVVETGCARFVVRPGVPFPIADAELPAGTLFHPRASVLRALTVHDTAVGMIEEVNLEIDGPLRAVVVARGGFRGRGAATALRFVARLHFHAGSATVRVSLAVVNPRRARHRRNQWSLGDPGSVPLKALELSVALANEPETVWCSVDQRTPPSSCELPFELYQDSSGGEHWNSPVHRNRTGVVPMRFRGYSSSTPAGQQHGLRADPVLTAVTRGVQSGVALPEFWQNCPRSVSMADDALVIGLFPRQHGDIHELQGGERKTHEIVLAFAHDRISEPPLVWCHDPLRVGCEPAWYAEAGALPCLTPAAVERDETYESVVRLAIDGTDTFEQKRERIDEYGWRHFGDLYADHEAVFHSGPIPLVSHYNNQYDAIAGCATQFFRDRDGRWWNLMDEMARHVADIDIYHTTEDKSAYNQGLFWHTNHYIDAGTASHRAYPDGGASSGGPSAEHNYTSGLMLHYFLTGHHQSLEAAVLLAEWVIAMDDGSRTVFRYLSRGPTGLASATWSPEYHGPGRGAANSAITCLNAWRLTADRRFLQKAEEIIRRCIHPEDDPAQHDLLDAERRWSYTVFLQALGVYLLDKEERGEVDAMYAYAQASLLRYVRWMAEAERPYLDRPEILEYPTETWAAQDMRKSEVFEYAAMHSRETERSRYFDRADFFFCSSIRTLATAPTASLTRPVVLMLACGWRHAWWIRERNRLREPVGPPARAFPPRRPFLPQKRVALRRARRIASIAGLLLILAMLALMTGRY